MKNIIRVSTILLLLDTLTINAQEVAPDSAKLQNQTSTNTASQDVFSETAKSLIPTVKAGNDIKLKIGGFFRAEYYVDSREIVGACDDLFGFFPERQGIRQQRKRFEWGSQTKYFHPGYTAYNNF